MIVIPRRGKGRPSAASDAAHRDRVKAFCAGILEIRGSLDFEVSARGWCYILEEHGATKADFPAIERLFVDCRKSGDLPLDICAEDEARAADHIETVTGEDPEEFVQGWIEHVRDSACYYYNPISIWKGQRVLPRDVGREDRPEVTVLRHLQTLHDPANQYPRPHLSQ